MLDINYVRDHLDEVRERLATRGFDTTTLDRFAELDVARRKAITDHGELAAERNRLSPEIGALMKEGKKAEADAKRERVKELKERMDALESQRDTAERELESMLAGVPNLPDASVPVGKDETANVEVRRWGAPPVLDFEPLDHLALGEKLGILDLPRAAKITGTRFPLATGAGALLERALANFMLDLHTREHGYTEVLPPYIVNADTLYGTGQLPKFEQDLFRLDFERPYYLIPTAEVPVTNIYRDEILSADRLPMQMTAFTPCFRSEAGSFGKDTRGMIRMHQFLKVELVMYATPDDSFAALERLTNHAEEVLRRLGLHYRTVALSTGDIGFSAAKTYDIEVWLPGQNEFREISSCSNCTDFQARRAAIRYRPDAGSKPVFVHTLNGSGLAVGRTWIAVMENYQQADGSVLIPDVLRPYMGGMERIG